MKRIVKTGFTLYLMALLLGFFPNKSQAQSNIYIASEDWCAPCKKLMFNLDKKGIKYNEFNNSEGKKDSLLIQLLDYKKKNTNILPVVFIDENQNDYFDDGEPYAIGSVMGEGLIDILNGNHKTVSKEYYNLFTTNGSKSLEKYQNVRLEGILREKDSKRDYLNLGGTKYYVTVKNGRNYFTVKYASIDSKDEILNIFKVQKDKSGNFNYLIIRKKGKNVSTEVPKEVLEHADTYLERISRD